MAIRINLDVMMAKRKIGLTDLAKEVDITLANLSILKNGKAKVDHLAHSCCDTEDLRGLAHWNLPSFRFYGMRSGSYKSEVTNGEACRILSITQIRLMNHLS